MDYITSLDELEAEYPRKPSDATMRKVMDHLTPLYSQWISASRFCVLGTVGPEGTDASPRGDDGPVVHILDAKTIALPDWRGNNRLDSLRNIVRDGRVSCMFMVPGCQNVVRLNGAARLTADPALRHQFARNGVEPATVIVIAIKELYFQCAKALMRSRLWQSDDERALLPTAGQLIQEFDETHDADSYDKSYPDYARKLLW